MLNPALIGYVFPAATKSWEFRDCILYALSVGAGPTELPFTGDLVEGVERQVLPTMAVNLGEPEGRPGPEGLGEYDRQGLVFAAQLTHIFGPIPTRGTISFTPRTAAMYDKGKAAIATIATESVEVTTGRTLFSNRSTYYMRGAGGWGGDRGPTPKAGPWTTGSHYDHSVTYATNPSQALLFRLMYQGTGDVHALHTDPAWAQRSGFHAPNLHGVCNLGFAGRALLHTLCQSDPARMCSIRGRFVGAVYPGELLDTQIWRDGPGRAWYRVVSSSGKTAVEGEMGYDGTYLDEE